MSTRGKKDQTSNRGIVTSAVGGIVDGDSAGMDADERQKLAAYLGRQICKGLVHHDRREWKETVASFYAVDRHQFSHLSDGEALEAATAYAAALWAKDAIEPEDVRTDGTFDPEVIGNADWSQVRACLTRRAEVVGIDIEYATLTTEGWRKHKTGDDYWTPLMRAQQSEIQTALGDPEYPQKPGSCSGGFGPLAARYLVGLELHDMKTERHWERAVDVMTDYFEEILRAHDNR